MQLKVEVLSKIHDRSVFDCGDEKLNAFIKNMAHQHIRKGLSRTFVLVEQKNPEKIIAYMTLVVCELFAENIPHQWKKKYPRTLPAAKLARLAVSQKQQKQGFGELLVVDAIHKTFNVSENMGIVGLFVDAKHEQAKNYYNRFGFLSLPEQLDNLFLPLSTIIEFTRNGEAEKTKSN